MTLGWPCVCSIFPQSLAHGLEFCTVIYTLNCETTPTYCQYMFRSHYCSHSSSLVWGIDDPRAAKPAHLEQRNRGTDSSKTPKGAPKEKRGLDGHMHMQRERERDGLERDRGLDKDIIGAESSFTRRVKPKPVTSRPTRPANHAHVQRGQSCFRSLRGGPPEGRSGSDPHRRCGRWAARWMGEWPGFKYNRSPPGATPFGVSLHSL